MGERERVRIEIAFVGGHTIGALVPPAAADGLAQALGGDRAGAFEVETDDGTYLVALANVVYVKRFARETQIGFGRAG